MTRSELISLLIKAEILFEIGGSEPHSFVLVLHEDLKNHTQKATIASLSESLGWPTCDQNDIETLFFVN